MSGRQWASVLTDKLNRPIRSTSFTLAQQHDEEYKTTHSKPEREYRQRSLIVERGWWVFQTIVTGHSGGS